MKRTHTDIRGKNVAVFIPNWIGDAAMCTPALRALRKQVGAAGRITAVLRPYVADVLAGTRWTEAQILCDRHSKNPAERAASVVKRMRRERFDAVVLLTNSFRAAGMAWLSGAPIRAGYVRNARGGLLTHKLRYPVAWGRRLPMPCIDEYLNIVYCLGCDPEPPRLELATLASDESAADAVWNKHQLPSGDRVIVLNSGGAYGAAKLWPSEYFGELARRIANELGHSVLVICGPAERQVAREIVAHAAHPAVVHLADDHASVGLSKACIRRSRLLVTTDSGPRFFGIAFGLPVVTLFGPTRIDWTRTHFSGEMCLQHAVPCGPCGRRQCPLGHHECMRALSVARVFASVSQQLEANRGDWRARGAA